MSVFEKAKEAGIKPRESLLFTYKQIKEDME